ncbi:MAG: translation initiation factor, partial [Bacteroidota bacterium]|nr:translation initiation factor [Bacteroidota bacterium]
MGRKKLYNTGGIVYSTHPGVVQDAASRETDTPPPQEQQLRLRLDTKHRAGKKVTLVEGFRGRAEDLGQLCKDLKSHCASGGTCEEDLVIIQGDHLEKIFQWL